MEPTLKTIAEKKLIGKHMKMSLANNKTGELWRSFMPRRREIQDTVTGDLFSLQNYLQPADLNNPNQEFEKWAAVEVTNSQPLPDGMDVFVIPAGQYAVFHYKGSSMDTSIFRFIFGEWLPASNYVLDARPHFEVLGDKYKNNDPDSEEDIWIPVKPKNMDGE